MWGAIIGAIIAAMGTYMNYNAQRKAANKVANENLRAIMQRNERERDTVDAVKNRSSAAAFNTPMIMRKKRRHRSPKRIIA